MRTFFLFLLLALLVRLLFFALLERRGPPLVAPVRIDVASGESFRRTAEKLEAEGLVPSASALALWARLRGLDRQVQYGVYEFREAASPLELLEKMRSGDVLVFRVTFQEGITAREIAAVLERSGLGKADEYVKLIRDAGFARSLQVPADSLEGYLFPDTYFFSPTDGPAKILGALVARFHQMTRPDLARRAEESGSSLHEIVTLASIVEEETGRPEERPLIAAVFQNRLRLGMPLQADPTVIYGIENFDGNLTRRHLQAGGPYNTYTFAGLPPGPICSPGREAIAAALSPADVDYLYFVARQDGSHEFTASLADHNRAVARYQQRRPASAAR